MLSFLKRNHDFLLLLIALVIYISNLNWFPFLFAMILYVWYRREVLWRVKHKKPFFHGKVVDVNPTVMGNRLMWRLFLMCVYGFIWVLVITYIIYFLKLEKYISFIFEYTLKYLYTGYHGFEIYDNIEPALYRCLLVLTTIYMVFKGRGIVLFTWYDYCIHIQNGGKNLWFTLSRGILGFRFLVGIGLVWLMYWVLFQFPVPFGVSCTVGIKIISCANNFDWYLFFRFIGRYFMWWCSIFMLSYGVSGTFIYNDFFGEVQRV
ncbi:hypothetical protein [Stenoxybacter acetivorans]|uniref:hypothetical protein n=1 Tax=Stenoxybacter acetivorans TaxID=422441 RepID=UPI00055D1C07|nr:hypothetical protein [Stenoxybacter acetivorans]